MIYIQQCFDLHLHAKETIAEKKIHNELTNN